MQCPCCKKEQHSCHVDRNMKLYRYKSSGKWVQFSVGVMEIFALLSLTRGLLCKTFKFNSKIPDCDWFTFTVTNMNVNLTAYCSYARIWKLFSLIHYRSRSKCYYGDIFIAEKESVQSHLTKLYKHPENQVNTAGCTYVNIYCSETWIYM